MKHRHIQMTLGTAIGLLFLLTNLVWAASWEGAVHFGLTATDGNSQTSNTNASVEAQKKETAYLLRAAATTTYGKTGGETSTDKSSRTDLRLLIQDIYNNTPVTGKERNDTTYIAAVGFKF